MILMSVDINSYIHSFSCSLNSYLATSTCHSIGNMTRNKTDNIPALMGIKSIEEWCLVLRSSVSSYGGDRCERKYLSTI